MSFNSSTVLWSYNGGSGATTFAYTQQILLATDLTCYLIDTYGATHPLTLNVDYTVNGLPVNGLADPNTGNWFVNYPAGTTLPSGWTFNIKLSVPYTQPQSLSASSGYSATIVEKNIADRLAQQTAQLAQEISEIRIAPDAAASAAAAAASAGAAATSATSAAASATAAATAAGNVIIYTYEGTATGGQTQIDVSSVSGMVIPSDMNYIEVYVDGVNQAKSSLTRISSTVIQVGGALTDGSYLVVKAGKYTGAVGGSTAWGSITGTLSNQTDLNTALNAKAADSAVVHNTGIETVAGSKTFTNGVLTPTVQATTSAGMAIVNAAGTTVVNYGIGNTTNVSVAGVLKAGSLTANRALVSDASQNISSSATTDTEIGYVSGVTSAIQTQLNAKASDSAVVHNTGNETVGGVKTFSSTPVISTATASTIAIFDASKNVISAATATYPSLTELAYGKGVTSAIQTQIDTVASTTTISSKSADYTLVLADKGTTILHPSADTTARTFTIPANASVAFAVGTVITFVNQNGAGSVSIAITTDTMRLAGAGTTGTRTLAANGVATAMKLTTTEWIISGNGLT